MGSDPTTARSTGGDGVRYAELLRNRFPRLDPEVDDLFLLEAHQVAALPDRAPLRELARVLHAHPRLVRFLVARYPPIREFVTRLLAEQTAAAPDALADCEQAVVWELADWIVYQRAPEDYDAGSDVDFDLAAVTDVVALDGKTIVDAGAGTGRVAFAAAPVARHVFAVEPVGTLRRFMREKAARHGIDNLFVIDGFLHAIPLPADTVDVLLTCQAVGWTLQEELVEVERVVKPGGFAQHLFGASSAAAPDHPLFAALTTAGYEPARYQSAELVVRSYWKQITA